MAGAICAGERPRQKTCQSAKRDRPSACCVYQALTGLVGRARQKRGEQRVFLGARGIDLFDVPTIRVTLAIEIRTQHAAIDAGRRFDGDDALRGNARPVGYRRLGNANFSGKRPHAAGGTNCFV